jgi:hypothetical protein
MARCRVTRHARQRAVERFGVGPGQADAFMEELFGRSRSVPRRYATDLGLSRGLRKGGCRYRVAGGAMLVVRGKTLVTTWRLDPEQLATVVWWAATGTWAPGVSS